MKKKRPLMIILISSILILSSCTSMKDLIGTTEPLWVTDMESVKVAGMHFEKGSADDGDYFARTENAIESGRNGLIIWAGNGITEIVGSYREKAGNRVNNAVAEGFLKYAPSYVPAWISSAEEKDRWEEDGMMNILLGIDTGRMMNDVKSFAEILLSKEVEQKEARNHARINLMAAIDGWFSRESMI